jgi:hypothetical protein
MGFSWGMALGISCAGMFVVSTIGVAEEVERLESRLPVLEEEVREACANERAGEARAALAYLTYARASSLTDELNREVAKVYTFLDSPEELAYRQLVEDLGKAREVSRVKYRNQLDLHVQQLDWMRLQVDSERPYSEGQMEEQRQRVKRSKRLLDYFSRADAIVDTVMPPEQMRKLLAIKIDSAMRRMKQMGAIGRRLDAASSRAWGCLVTATNSGRMAAPAVELDIAGGSR